MYIRTYMCYAEMKKELKCGLQYGSNAIIRCQPHGMKKTKSKKKRIHARFTRTGTFDNAVEKFLQHWLRIAVVFFLNTVIRDLPRQLLGQCVPCDTHGVGK